MCKLKRAFAICRTKWELKEIAKAQDGTYELYYDTPDGTQKVCLPYGP